MIKNRLFFLITGMLILLLSFQNCQSGYENLNPESDSQNNSSLSAEIDVMSFYPSGERFPELFYDIQSKKENGVLEWEVVFAFPDSLTQATKVEVRVLDADGMPVCAPHQKTLLQGRGLIGNRCQDESDLARTIVLLVEGGVVQEKPL